jgi:hypothetical protein
VGAAPNVRYPRWRRCPQSTRCGRSRIRDNGEVQKFDLADPEGAFAASQSGRGLYLETAQQLSGFAAYARTRAAVVCNVETFELNGQQEITRLDLFIVQGGREDCELPAAERIRRSDQALIDMLATIEKEGINCAFQVWTDNL